MLGTSRPPLTRLRLSCRVSCALPGRSGHAGEREGSRTRSRARPRPATASGCAGSATPERANAVAVLHPRRPPAQADVSPSSRSCGGRPVTPGWWSAGRSVTCPLPGTRCPGQATGVIGKRHDQLPPFTPSPRRRPGDRVRAGRLHATADRPPDVGTSDPDPRFAVG